MKRSLNVFSTGLMFSLLLTGCNGGGGSSPVSSNAVTSGLTMTGSGQNAVAMTPADRFMNFFMPNAIALTPPPLFDANSAAVSLNEAWIVIEEIEFEANEAADGAETDGDEVEFTGPYFVDLLSDAPVSFGNAVLPATGIRRVKMQLHEAETLPAEAPVELTSRSIYFSGSVNGVSFSYGADDSTEFEISGANPIVPSSSQDLLIVIRMADLFQKIDMSSIAAPTDIHSANRVNAVNPCPLIDASATDLYTCFRKGLESEGNFGKDDGDNDLDANDESVD